MSKEKPIKGAVFTIKAEDLSEQTRSLLDELFTDPAEFEKPADTIKDPAGSIKDDGPTIPDKDDGSTPKPGECVCAKDGDTTITGVCERTLSDGTIVLSDGTEIRPYDYEVTITREHKVNLEGLRQGDHVTLRSGTIRVSGTVDHAGSVGDGRKNIGLIGDWRGYRVGPKSEWKLEHAHRSEGRIIDDLPKDDGFYRAADGSVWQQAGTVWNGVIDADGDPLSACLFRPEMRRRAIEQDMYPFVPVKVSFGAPSSDGGADL